MAQQDFLNVNGHPYPPVPPSIDLRGDLRPAPGTYIEQDPAKWPDGALDKLYADIVAAPAACSDVDDDGRAAYPAPPVNPTTQAMALKAGQKHVDPIKAGKLPTGPSRDLTPDEMASRYGLYADDSWPPLDSKIYDMFQQQTPAPPRATVRPLRAFAGPNGRVRIDADKTRVWQGWGGEFDERSAPDKRTAWTDRRVVLALVVAVAVVGAAVAVTVFSLPEYLPVLKANWPWR